MRFFTTSKRWSKRNIKGNNNVSWITIGWVYAAVSSRKEKEGFSSANLLSLHNRRAVNALVSNEDERVCRSLVNPAIKEQRDLCAAHVASSASGSASCSRNCRSRAAKGTTHACGWVRSRETRSSSWWLRQQTGRVTEVERILEKSRVKQNSSS